ncbi:MAG: DUF3127 domain-containing protein [Prevotellaceae bacterium]|nr:DUF3127 domain-containing protein [Prevotellaceae bacterium]
MEITGKIIQVLPERSGTSARTGSEWRVASYVLETREQYPKKMCFDVFGSDRIQLLGIKAGETLTVKFDIDAHEYQGRWFNSIRAYGVDRGAASAPQPVAQPASQAAPLKAAPQGAAEPAQESEPDEQLPF